MLDTEIETTESSKDANGISTQVEIKTTDKPWIAAGFKTRAEMRAAKAKEAKDKVYAEGMGAIREMANKSAKKEGKSKSKKPAVAKATTPVKKSTKKLVKKTKVIKEMKPAKSKAKAPADKRKSPAEPKKGMVKDGSLEPVAFSELSPRMKSVLFAMKRDAVMALGDIQAKAFPNMVHKKGSSTTRNQLRFLRVHGMVKLLGEGRYKRLV